ncbi:MAG: hypothetical protein ACR2IE_13125 [Candidatus Sumerlaeaceae bacterium]
MKKQDWMLALQRSDQVALPLAVLRGELGLCSTPAAELRQDRLQASAPHGMAQARRLEA